MKKIMKRLEDIYAAVAFAEAGEFETAKEILREEERQRDIKRITQRPRKQLRAPGIKQ
jgi:hypothetical protein